MMLGEFPYKTHYKERPTQEGRKMIQINEHGDLIILIGLTMIIVIYQNYEIKKIKNQLTTKPKGFVGFTTQTKREEK